MKKSLASSAHVAPAAESGRATKRRKIDFSEIAELSPAQLSTMRRVGRPPHGDQPRKLISIHLDQKVLAWVKAQAIAKDRPYQSLIGDILEQAMKRTG